MKSNKAQRTAWNLTKLAGVMDPMDTSNGLHELGHDAKGPTMATNATIASFDSFNQRRYGTPWVCVMTKTGGYDFDAEVGAYTGDGRRGEEGDLVVFEPVVGQVYGYGQKDYRGNNTIKKFAKWDGKEFVECDKLGR